MKQVFPSFRLSEGGSSFFKLGNVPGGNRRGFTLVEILVAIAVLALLVILTAQLTNNATSIITFSNKRMDVDSEAHLVFSRMAEDLQGMLHRPDIDCFFVKNTGNDAFYFYSQSTGYHQNPTSEGPPSPFTLVGYRIANRAAPSTVAPNGVLERVGIGMAYDNTQSGTIIRFLTYPVPTVAVPSPLPLPMTTIAYGQGSAATGNPTYSNEIGTAPTWDNPPYMANNQAILSSRVFRLEFCFLMDDGTYYVPPPPGSTPWSYVPPGTYTPAANEPTPITTASFLNDMKKIRAHAVSLIVTVAILDDKSQAMMPKSASNTPDFTKAIAALADGDVPNVEAAWQNTLVASLASPSTVVATLGMPEEAAAQIRVYQRSFQLAP